LTFDRRRRYHAVALPSVANILLVGFGGFAGAIARYLLGGWILHHSLGAKFPWSTFTVNVLGCLLMGVLSALIERLDLFSPHARLLLLTGLLGGFTTFSAFGLETVYLLRRGETWIALTYVTSSVVCCVLALWAGLKLLENLPRSL
jgi:CrcB protein